MKQVTRLVLPVLSLLSAARGQESPLDPAAAPNADRIWSQNADDRDVWLRRNFALPAQVSRARFVFSCDNECRVLVNGAEVANSRSWTEVTVVDLEGLGRDNVIAVEAKNTGGPGAFAGWLLWTDDERRPQHLISDTSWKVTTAAADVAEGWADIDFDDSDWSAATASFDSVFGRNLYNDTPSQVLFRNRRSAGSDAIAKGLEQLRRSLDRENARKALDAIERAVMEMRAALWQEERDEQAAGTGR